MRFCAVVTDRNGLQHTLATSPEVEWLGSAPPDQSPEARAALRELSKTVRDSGWRPLRAKGKDFGERRWYARRFRPVAAQAADDAGLGARD
jgi:hypothetical protein